MQWLTLIVTLTIKSIIYNLTIYNHLGMRLSKELSRLSRPVSMLFFRKITERGGIHIEYGSTIACADPGLGQKGKRELRIGMHPHILSLLSTVSMT